METEADESLERPFERQRSKRIRGRRATRRCQEGGVSRALLGFGSVAAARTGVPAYSISRATQKIDSAAANDRIVRIDGFVPFEGVRDLYEAADVAVVPRANGGTSVSLILALSLGTPPVAADMPAYRRAPRRRRRRRAVPTA